MRLSSMVRVNLPYSRYNLLARTATGDDDVQLRATAELAATS
jgi:hypothetical protein